VELLCIGFLELFCFLSGRIPYGLYEEETIEPVNYDDKFVGFCNIIEPFND
jgi:hypothetical protein